MWRSLSPQTLPHTHSCFGLLSECAQLGCLSSRSALHSCFYLLTDCACAVGMSPLAFGPRSTRSSRSWRWCERTSTLTRARLRPRGQRAAARVPPLPRARLSACKRRPHRQRPRQEEGKCDPLVANPFCTPPFPQTPTVLSLRVQGTLHSPIDECTRACQCHEKGTCASTSEGMANNARARQALLGASLRKP